MERIDWIYYSKSDQRNAASRNSAKTNGRGQSEHRRRDFRQHSRARTRDETIYWRCWIFLFDKCQWRNCKLFAPRKFGTFSACHRRLRSFRNCRNNKTSADETVENAASRANRTNRKSSRAFSTKNWRQFFIRRFSICHQSRFRRFSKKRCFLLLSISFRWNADFRKPRTFGG